MSDYEATLNFAGEHYFLAFCALYFAYAIAIVILRTPFHLWNRWLRSRNIKAHGWPTAPLDADGDIVYPKASEP